MNNFDVKKRIVVTGGPGGGKTTAIDLFRREFPGKIVVVPEAATMIFSGGIQRSNDLQVICAQQIAIFNLQKHLENIQRAKYPDCLMLCDRGSIDGLAYWPGSQQTFFEQMNSSLEYELRQYDAVIFFETAANSGGEISSNNPIRNESQAEAIKLDVALQKIWSCHPNYNFVASSASFINKIMFGINTIEQVIDNIR
jgi:predicted ATPase